MRARCLILMPKHKDPSKPVHRLTHLDTDLNKSVDFRIGPFLYLHVSYFSGPLLFIYHTCYVLVCVDVLRPSQPNGVMSSAVSLPNHTFTGQA